MTIPTPDESGERVSDEELIAMLEKWNALGPSFPWRVESDWSWEVTGADGRIICKLPMPDPHGFTPAGLIADSFNALPKIIRELQRRRSTDTRTEVIEECAKVADNAP